MEKVRDYQFDNIKAILIFLVVFAHILSHFGTSEAASILYKIIYSFHMPAFIFISGYFASFNPKKLFSKMFPLYIVFQVIQLVENFLIQWITTGEPSRLTIDIFVPNWTMWYLVALMVYQLLIPVFDTDNRKKQLGFLILALALGFLIGFSTNAGDIFSLTKLIFFLPFFMLGYYERKNGFLRAFGRDYFKKGAKALAVIAGAGMITSFCLLGDHVPKTWLYNFGHYSGPTSMIFRILFWIMALLWIMILLIWVPKRPLGYIETIGKNTLAIYLLHGVALLILEQTPLKPLIRTNMLTLLLTSAIMTLVFSWNGFEKFINKIRLPYSQEQPAKDS